MMKNFTKNINTYIFTMYQEFSQYVWLCTLSGFLDLNLKSRITVPQFEIFHS